MKPSKFDARGFEQCAVALLQPSCQCGQNLPRYAARRYSPRGALHPHRIQEALQGGIRRFPNGRYRFARGACINRPFESVAIFSREGLRTK